MWYVVGKDMYNLKLVWSEMEPKGESVFHGPTNNIICINTYEEDRDKEQRFIFVRLDSNSWLSAEAVDSINELDEMISEGQGVQEQSTYDMEIYYGYYVNPETKELVNPEPHMWFRGFENTDEIKLGEEDMDTMMLKWKEGDKEWWAVLKVSGLNSENINLLSSNFELPPNYKERWNEMVTKGEEECIHEEFLKVIKLPA